MSIPVQCSKKDLIQIARFLPSIPVPMITREIQRQNTPTPSTLAFDTPRFCEDVGADEVGSEIAYD